MRKAATLLLLLFGIVWALFIAPEIVSLILSGFGSGVELLLVGSFPSLMRSAMLFVWIIFLVYPISYALQEIQIGQWEIMLSNNVSTREMMFGMFMGKIPVYGLLVLYVAPIMLSPFTTSLQVVYLGQAIMYLIVFFVAISTLFLSTLITTAIQAKLGESSRGNDIAKALAMVVAVVVLIPMYGLMYFANSMSAALGMDVFLLFPFTWGADIISWTIINFNGLGIPATAFLDVLKLGPTIDLVLLLSFTGFIILVAYRAADRIFSFGAGPRTEKITTVGKENLFVKGVRKVFPGAFGVLVANSIKEFTRKMQNVSRLLYGVVLSILLPVIMSYSVGNAPEEIPPEFRWLLLMIVIIMIGIMLSMITGITFGGIGFLESKDQLWIIKSAPNGARKFANARLVESLLLAIPIAVAPSIFAAVVFGFGIVEMAALIAYAYWMTFGSVLLCIGITSINPAYENQKSSAFYINTFASIFLIILSMMISFFLSFSILMITSNLGMFMVVMSAPLVIIGSVTYVIGVSRLSKADIN